MYFYSKHIPIILFVAIHGLLSVSSDSLCVPGFQCIHGKCTSGITCQCDEGWTGDICDQSEVMSPTTDSSAFSDIKPNITEPVSVSTLAAMTPPPGNTQGNETEDFGGGTSTEGEVIKRKECFSGYRCEHGMCIIQSKSFGCQCDAGWTGPFCKQQILDTSTPKAGHTTTNLDTHFGPKPKWAPMEGQGPLAEFSLRLCIPGFECRYGNCSCQNCSPKESAYSCICEKDWTGTFCHKHCPLKCGPDAKCESNGTNSWCQCDPLFSGNGCVAYLPDDEYEYDSDEIYVYAISVSVSIVVVLVILLALVPYLLWRRGNLSMLKLVFWFQTIEEDDGRMYDAFVSYASTEEDRQFVMDCLIPVLEDQMSFTLCVHERDFMPGKYITCNIMESVRQSRRTLMVVSPAFVSRNWCQFEFQTAVAEMIEQRHRILPVMMGDIQQIKQESNMNKTFQRVINTVTYLQYPGEGAPEEDFQKFWKRLQLSMPKKTMPSSSSAPCSPVQTPTSITPLSLSLPSQQIAHKSNRIIFPTSSHKINNLDEINIEPAPSPNHTNVNTENKHQSPKRSDQGGFISWFRKKIIQRKKSVHKPKYSPNHTPVDVRTNNSLHIKEFHGHCVNTGDHNTSENLNGKDKEGDRGLKPLQIELSGWTWPTCGDTQETC